MIKKFNKRFGKDEYIINPGEIYSSNQDIVITTVLGSCIAVCLYDSDNKMAGMNHFMLPGRYEKGEILSNESARFGLNSMEYLISGLMKMGARRRNFKAKVFGGGHVFEGVSKITVPADNIEFIHDFLSLEEIPLVREDVGGSDTRKVHFLTSTAKVLMQRINSAKREVQSEKEKEKQYGKQIAQEKKEYLVGDLTVFE
jgi:chemotaxis protein CheD